MPDLTSLLQRPVHLGRRGLIESRAAMHAWRAGMIGADPPKRALAVFLAMDRLGQLGGAVAIAALRHGEQVGLIDELGSLTFAELDARSDALTCGLRARGLREGDGIGILCRNHRGFLDITFAGSKLGARILYLNTDFAGPQLRDVCERENISLLVHDEEYNALVAPIQTRHGRLLGWTDGEPPEESLLRLLKTHAGQTPPAPTQPADVVLLTSGTTGTPKGAPRHQSRSLAPIGALLSKVPYRSRESTYVAAPMFHGLGFTQMVLSVILGCTTIVQRRFHPNAVLEAIERERPTALVVVPVMLSRIVSVLEQEPGHDTGSLRIVFCSGAQLEAELVRRAQRTIGDKLYNFYGSTEVAYATFATPEDLRAAPGTAGCVPFGAVVQLFDGAGGEVSGPGQVGRIFVGNGFQFAGYTGGGNKEVIDGLMSTGDVGHFDAAGRLFIDGRDDDMIVSGGENLFPGEVEELLITHPAVEEASVIGVDDPDFGKRLAAFVVLGPRASLSEDDVREFVRQNLARYKVPRDVHFIDELPRNPTGKVLKRRLRERYAAA
jgi:fatty-acyl-CoA synthase